MNSTINLTEEQINDKIQFYKDCKVAYYTTENPLVSDEEYDQLEQFLLSNNFIDESMVGYDIEDTIPNGKNKNKHPYRMLSLGKQQNMEDHLQEEVYDALVKKFGDNVEGELSWKYDGIAIDVVYINKTLYSISTRGDGEYGVDITEKFRFMFPNEINVKGIVSIRGEMVINENLFKTKYSNYSHSRNFVGGVINDEDLNDERKNDLTFVHLTTVKSQKILRDFVFSGEYIETKEVYKMTLDNTDNNFDNWNKIYSSLNKKRPFYDYNTDGLVFEIIQDKFEHNNKHPKNAIAIKFKPPRLIATVIGIEWNLKKGGKYYPIVYITPIVVDGRVITKASGHNISYLIKNEIVKGKEVELIMSNDIIPMLKK